MPPGPVTAAVLATAVAGAWAQPAPEWTMSERDRGYVVFLHSTLENLPSDHVPDREAIAGPVACAIAQGEYESLHLGVHALAEGLAHIEVTVTSDLPVTVYHRVDPEVMARLGAVPDEEMPTWRGSPVCLRRGQVVAALAPASTAAFWLTFQAGPDAAPGVHRGTIRVAADGRPATEVDLRVRVRPFALEAPRAAFGMYYREDMLPTRFGSWAVSDGAALAIYRDMAAHGQNSVSFYQMGDFRQLPPTGSLPVDRTLALAREAGLTHPDVPCMVLQANIVSEFSPGGLSAEQMRSAVAWLRSATRERGWPELMVYGWDEAPYPAPGLRQTYGPLRQFPIRVCAAMNATGAFAYGDVHDVWIAMGGEVTPQMQAEAERLGAQVWTYSYRILREGYSPLRQRYYAGLYTWALELAGNYVWAYAHGNHSHAWWEPGRDEPMPITGWEARREGVDDYRYLQMLEDRVRAAGSNPTALKAGAWLQALRERLGGFDPHDAKPGEPLALGEYEAIRDTACAYIEQLGSVPPGGIEPRPVVPYLKDEAAAFRGTSVAQCQSGLGSASAPTRRAAATALFEMGPQAAPAVAQLARALGDVRVRIPALRALEAIGPPAGPALSEVASLLGDPDGFVRLSATLTLAGIARPASWSEALRGRDPDDASASAPVAVAPLLKALADANPQVASAAAVGLFHCGAAAAPALPTALDLLAQKTNDEAARVVLAGLGPAAAGAVPTLVQRFEAAKGQDPWGCLTLAAIGAAAAAAVPALEPHRTPDNPYLAHLCYALYCIRGDEGELATLAGLIGQQGLPLGAEAWQAAARFLGALGGQAAPVVPQVRQRLALLDGEPVLKRQIETSLLQRAADGARPLRLLPR